MKIEYFGHSCFKISSAAGSSVVCDPFDGAIGYSLPRLTADAVTLSHRHFDHCFVQAVGGSPEVIEGGERTVGDIKISSAHSWHDEAGGAKRGANTIFSFTADGVTVRHLGDLGEPFSCARARALAPCDVLLIPVGGTYTITAAEAEKYVRAVSPAIAIPMHYRTRECVLDIDGAEGFLKLFDSGEIVEAESNFIEITGKLSGGKTKIILLKR